MRSIFPNLRLNLINFDFPEERKTVKNGTN